MITVQLSVDPHYKARPPHVLFEKHFETWAQTKKFLLPLGLVYESSFGDLHKLLHDFEHDNEYVGVELELKEQTGTSYTSAVLSIEGREEPRRSSGEVYILTTWYAGKIVNQEVFDSKPTFRIPKNMELRVANINGGDSVPVTN